jgi:hypothetical protein
MRKEIIASEVQQHGEPRLALDCGNLERHEYELYLAVEDIDHTRTLPTMQAAAHPSSALQTM